MLSRTLIRKMSQDTFTKLINKAEIAEKQLADIRIKLNEVKKVKIEDKIKELTQENKDLFNEIEKVKAELIKLETLNGKKQYVIPGKDVSNSVSTIPVQENNVELKEKEQIPKKHKKDDAKITKAKIDNTSHESDIIDVRKLDFRIGKIIDISKHPDADTLYVEKIDCGEDGPRTVVSGLVNHVPIEEMRDRMVMVLCNLKPVKMRGVLSQAMVMCASSAEKVEVLLPPSDAVPGDLVLCLSYPREPEVLLNPKKKIFETCAPDLKTNDEKVACYKGCPLLVQGKGNIVAPTLKEASVK